MLAVGMAQTSPYGLERSMLHKTSKVLDVQHVNMQYYITQ